MRVFVTGGSGFVGGHFIERLAGPRAEAKYEVFALARSAGSARLVEGYGARAVTGELGAVRADDLRGVDAVVHAAAFVDEWGTREQFEQGNVHGTAQLLAAAREAGVRRFVHVGTEAALFDGHPLRDIDEHYPYPRKQRYLYSETKAEAERRVLSASGADFVTVSVRPRLVWGPRDASVLPAVLRMARDGAFSWIDGGAQRTSTTHVYNLAHALERALTRGRGGEAYFVADDETSTMRSFLTAAARTQGVELGGRSVPSWVLRPAAAGVEAAFRAARSKKPPPLTRFAIDMMSSEVTVRTEKARRELGYAPVISLEAGMRELAEAGARA